MKRLLFKALTFLMFLLGLSLIFVDKNIIDHNLTYDEYYQEYQALYPLDNYVDEELNASKTLHNLVMSTLLNSNVFFQPKNDELRTDSFFNIINEDIDFNAYIESLQYQEEQPSCASAQHIETYSSNMYYSGYLEDGTKINGNISSESDLNTYNLILSFTDKNSQMDENKLRLLADDSNSEKITYDIIAYLQYENQTNMNPDIASYYFFDSSIEEVAGSISYHAAIGLYVIENNLDAPIVIDRTKQVNIETVELDSFVVNHKY